MKADRWRQVDKIFHDLIEQTPQDRASLLDRICADDPLLKKEVEDLIQAYERSGSFLDSPAPVSASGSLIGRTLGSYELKALLGSGGMGEVYRARDSKLKRDVAIKLLPATFSRDPDRVARFQREAEVLASLNHPNIAAIYDLALSDDSRFLVLELVEGETLAELLVRRPIPMTEALEIAKQIAEALEAAHERGIIHRDLKPANVKITPEGRIKVLDFGLAKVLEDAADASVSPSNSPTMLTAPSGIMMGTTAYMSPEQARGQAVDKRTDIWTFGCVLYEMSTGRQAFAGDTISDTIARILERGPDWTALPANMPVAIRRLLQRCLDKNPKRRLHDIADARVEIEDALSEPVSSLTSRVPVRKSRKRLWIAAIVVVIVALVVNAAYNRNAPEEAREIRLQIVTPPGTDLTSFAMSPDGRSIVFHAQDQLWLRPLESERAQPLVGTEEGEGPFWKPDSQSIGFFARGQLKVIHVKSGILQTLAPAPTYGSGTWSEGGIILFAPSGIGPLSSVPEGGGQISEAGFMLPKRRLPRAWRVTGVRNCCLYCSRKSRCTTSINNGSPSVTCN